MGNLFEPPKEELMQRLIRSNTKALVMGMTNGRADIIEASLINLHAAVQIAAILMKEGKIKDDTEMIQIMTDQTDLALQDNYTQEMANEGWTWARTNLDAVLGQVR